MASRKHRSSSRQNILKGLKQVGTTAKNVAIPAISKGVSAVYNTMAKGVDVGTRMVRKSRRQRAGSKKTLKHRRR